MYALTLLSAIYLSFFGMLALVYRELPKVRGAKQYSEGVEPAIFQSIERIVRDIAARLWSVLHTGLFKVSAFVHGLTAKLTTKLYRRATETKEAAEVSTLLRSLKESDSHNMVR